MTQVDQFESVFRAAFHDVFQYQEIHYEKALAIIDLPEVEALEYSNSLETFLIDEKQRHWEVFNQADFEDLGTLLEAVLGAAPDLLVTYRNLGSANWRDSHTLGEALDLLLQRTPFPVLVLPHPKSGEALEHAVQDRDRVLVLTDHLNHDPQLVNAALHMAQRKGELTLLHVEDEDVFERYLEVISKIPTIDTEDARQRIAEQLLKDPADYMQSIKKELKNHQLPIQVKGLVEFGNHLNHIQEIIEKGKIDLVVMNTRDSDQIALHGLAYPIAMEVRHIPLLML
ncbi:universal stress protein [bacterium]|nr:universal stress protein [bacterium]